MKQHEITIGGRYLAKVSGKVTTVRVTHIYYHGDGASCRKRYDVVNETTGRRITFRSAGKFRGLPPTCFVGALDRQGRITVQRTENRDEALIVHARFKTNYEYVRVGIARAADQKTAYERFQTAWSKP